MVTISVDTGNLSWYHMYMQFSRFLLSKTIHNQRSALFGLCLTSCLCSLVVCKELVFSLTDYIVLITKPFFNLKTSYSFESSWESCARGDPLV